MNFKDIFFKEKDTVKEIPKSETRSFVQEQILQKYPDFELLIKGNTGGYGCLSLSAVYCALELISNSIAGLPFIIKSKDNELPKEQFGTYFKDQPINQFVFKKMMIKDLMLYGNAYCVIEKSGRKIKSLRYVEYNDMNTYYDKMRNVVDYKCAYYPGVLMAKDVIHLVKNSDNGVEGKGFMTFARRAIGLSQATEESANSYYSQGLNLFGILHATTPLTKYQADQLSQNFSGSVDNSKGNTRIKFIPADVKFEPLSQNAKDAALIETRTFNIAEIARFFNISPILLNDLTHGNYNDIEVQNISFLTNTLLPYIRIIEDEFTRKLFPKDDYYLDIDETEMLRMKSNDSANYYNTLVSSGILSVNEVRNELGFEPIEGGDNHIIAYTDISQNTINKDDSEKEKSEEKIDDEKVDSVVSEEKTDEKSGEKQEKSDNSEEKTDEKLIMEKKKDKRKNQINK